MVLNATYLPPAFSLVTDWLERIYYGYLFLPRIKLNYSYIYMNIYINVKKHHLLLCVQEVVTHFIK